MIIGIPDTKEPGFLAKFIICETAPPAVFGATTVAHHGSMVMFGGFDSVTSTPSNGLYSLALSDLNWKQLEIPENSIFPSARYHHTAVQYKSSMIIYGGIGENGMWLNDLWAIDVDNLPNATNLSPSGELPPAMRGHAACIGQEFMFIFGSAQHSSEGILYRLDLQHMTWSRMITGGTPVARDFHSLVCPNDRLLLLFGGLMRTTTAVDDVLGDCWVLDVRCPTAECANLPVDVWLEILQYLDFVSLIKVSRTCKAFYHMAKTEPLWSQAYNREWNLPGENQIMWKNAVFTYEEGKTHLQPPPPRFTSHNRDHEPACFGPFTTLKMHDGSLKNMRSLLVGDKVITGTGAICTVSCIWKYVLHTPAMLICKHSEQDKGNLLQITTDHPIMHKGTWTLPTVLGPAAKVPDVDCVYNLAIDPDDSHNHTNQKSLPEAAAAHNSTVVAGGVICCTLGTPVPPPMYDPFWSSHQVIDWLEARPDYPNVVTFALVPSTCM